MKFIVFTLLFGIVTVAQAEYENFQAAVKRDCERTILRVMSREGASWNSEWGTFGEERCWQYWPSNQKEMVSLVERNPDFRDRTKD